MSTGPGYTTIFQLGKVTWADDFPCLGDEVTLGEPVKFCQDMGDGDVLHKDLSE